MTPVETLILVLYFFVLSILAIYGWHRYYLIRLYTRNQDKVPADLPPPAREDMVVAAGHFPAPGFGKVIRLEGRRYWQVL